MPRRFIHYSLDVPDHILLTIPNLCTTQWSLTRDNFIYNWTPVEGTSKYCHFTDGLYLNHPLFQWKKLHVLYPHLPCWWEYSEHFRNIKELTYMEIMIEANTLQVLRYGERLKEYPDIPECTAEILTFGEQFIGSIAGKKQKGALLVDYPFDANDFEWKNSDTLQQEKQIIFEISPPSFWYTIGIITLLFLPFFIVLLKHKRKRMRRNTP